MDRSRESMAIEVRVPLLSQKLWNLYEYEGIRSSRSKETAKSAIEQLELIASWIRDANEETIRSDLEAFWRMSLSMEDRIDTFIVTTEQWRRITFYQMVSSFFFLESREEKLLRKEMAEVIDLAKRLNQQAPRPLADGTGSHPQQPQLSSSDNMALDDSDSDFIRFNDEETELKDHRFDPKRRKLLRGEEMAEAIDLAKRLNQQAPRPLADGTGSHPQQPQLSSSDNMALDDSNFIRFNDEEIELKGQLFDPQRRKSETIIAVTGKAGSGKTFLTKTIYKMEAVQAFFNCRAWVDVSEDFKARDFLVDILTQLSRERLDENLPDIELGKRLNSLTKARHCLIVVDDVRTHNDLEKLSIVLSCIDGPSRLILTTRDKDLARYASKGRNPVMPRLNKDDCWTLFLKKAPEAEHSFTAPELIDLKNKILMKCDGSPQAILILGGLLSARNPSEWSSVINQLSDKGLKELSRVNEHAFGLSIEELTEWSKVMDPSARKNILDLSYEYLPPLMKFCFLYLGLFPKEFKISVRRLFHHWLAEGLVIPFEQMAPEDLVKEYLNKLIRRNMIEVAKVRLDGSPKTCLMQGSIWDVFHPKAVDLRLFHVHNNNTVYPSAETVPFEHRIQRLVEYAGIQNYPELDHFIQYLRSYVCFNTRKRDLPSQEIGMFLTTVVNRRGFGLLIVLDLEKVFKPRLPDILGKLFHLKYLGLRWTSLDSLPMSVGYLPYLETLDVKHTDIDTLPSSIWKAKKLKHLYLNEIHLGKSTKQLNSGPLTNIRTLTGLLLGRESHVKTCLNLIGLRKLGLTCYSTLQTLEKEELADWISKLTDLQSLKLRSSDPYGHPSTLKLGNMLMNHKLSDLYLLGQLQFPRPIIADLFPPSLKILTLSVSLLEKDPLQILGKLPCLNILRLLQNSYTGRRMTCYRNGFPQLRVLKLWMLENLMYWIVEQGAMPQLVELEIRDCHKLHKLATSCRFENLKKVTLMDMPSCFVDNINRVMTTAIVISYMQGENAQRQESESESKSKSGSESESESESE